jgi:hypothetical protein
VVGARRMVLAPTLEEEMGMNLLASQDARPGMRVRVHNSYRNPQFEGMLGTIKNCFGDPEYPALDVRLDDGRLELFWIHQLERVEGA